MLLCGGCFPDRDMLVVVVEVGERAVVFLSQGAVVFCVHSLVHFESDEAIFMY